MPKRSGVLLPLEGLARAILVSVVFAIQASQGVCEEQPSAEEQVAQLVEALLVAEADRNTPEVYRIEAEIRAFGATAVPACLDLVDAGRFDVGTRILGGIEGPESTAAILSLLTSDDRHTRSRAMSALLRREIEVTLSAEQMAMLRTHLLNDAVGWASLPARVIANVPNLSVDEKCALILQRFDSLLTSEREAVDQQASTEGTGIGGGDNLLQLYLKAFERMDASATIRVLQAERGMDSSVERWVWLTYALARLGSASHALELEGVVASNSWRLSLRIVVLGEYVRVAKGAARPVLEGILTESPGQDPDPLKMLRKEVEQELRRLGN